MVKTIPQTLPAAFQGKEEKKEEPWKIIDIS